MASTAESTLANAVTTTTPVSGASQPLFSVTTSVPTGSFAIVNPPANTELQTPFVQTPAVPYALTDGTTANTVFWYTGENGSTPALQTALKSRIPTVIDVRTSMDVSFADITSPLAVAANPRAS